MRIKVPGGKHQGTPFTPNHSPNGFRFEPDGFSLTPMCVIASASARSPGELRLCVRRTGVVAGSGAAAGAFAGFCLSAASVSGPAMPSTSSLRSRWKSFTAAAVAGP